MDDTADPFDSLAAAPNYAGTVAREAQTAPDVLETPDQTEQRVAGQQKQAQQVWSSLQVVKAKDLQTAGIPSYTDSSGTTQPVTDSSGTAVTDYDKKNNVGWDSQGNPVQVKQNLNAPPSVEDAFAGLGTTTDKKTGDQYKIRSGLPWQWQGQDPDIAAQAQQADQDKAAANASTALGRKLTLDERQFHVDNTAFAHQSKALASTFGLDGTEDLPAAQKKISDSFNNTQDGYGSPQANETEGYFGSGPLTPEAQTYRDQLDQKKAAALQQASDLNDTQKDLATRKATLDQQETQRQALAQMQVDTANRKLAAAGVMLPGTEAATDTSTGDTDNTAPRGTTDVPQVSSEVKAQAIQDAAAGKKPYSITQDGALQLSDQQPLASIQQAVKDGLLPQPPPEVMAAAAQKQKLIEDAGSHPEIKAALAGAGRGAAFLAGAPVGAGAGALIPGLGETGIGELAGGLVSGSLAAYGYSKLIGELGKYNSTINSFVASQQLHPGYSAAGEFAAFGAGLPKALMKGAGGLLSGASDTLAESSQVTGATADAVRATIAQTKAAAKAAEAATGGTATVLKEATPDIYSRASDLVDAIGKAYSSSGGGLLSTIQNLSDLAATAAAQKGPGFAAAQVAKRVGIAAAGMVAIDTTLKEGSKALGLSDEGQTWGGVTQAAVLGAFASGHGIAPKDYDSNAVGDIILRGMAHDVTGTDPSQTVDMSRLASTPDIGSNVSARMTHPLTPEEQEIYSAFNQKASQLINEGKLPADPSQWQAKAKQILFAGRKGGVVNVEITPKAPEAAPEPPPPPVAQQLAAAEAQPSPVETAESLQAERAAIVRAGAASSPDLQDRLKVIDAKLANLPATQTPAPGTPTTPPPTPKTGAQSSGGAEVASGGSITSAEEKPTIDDTAHAAVTSLVNPKPAPTPLQEKAENFEMDHPTVAGLPLSITHPIGAKRNPDRFPDAKTLTAHYGYIRGTIGADGEKLDAFVKGGTPNAYDGPIYVVNQNKQDGTFDEHKIVVGANSPQDAQELYERQYPPGFARAGSVATFSTPEAFKQWTEEGDKSAPAVGDVDLGKLHPKEPNDSTRTTAKVGEEPSETIHSSPDESAKQGPEKGSPGLREGAGPRPERSGLAQEEERQIIEEAHKGAGIKWRESTTPPHLSAYTDAGNGEVHYDLNKFREHGEAVKRQGGSPAEYKKAVATEEIAHSKGWKAGEGFDYRNMPIQVRILKEAPEDVKEALEKAYGKENLENDLHNGAEIEARLYQFLNKQKLTEETIPDFAPAAQELREALSKWELPKWLEMHLDRMKRATDAGVAESAAEQPAAPAQPESQPPEAAAPPRGPPEKPLTESQKAIGEFFGARPVAEFYKATAEDVLEQDTKTKPVEPSPEEIRDIQNAYHELRAKSNFSTIKISDVMERAGYEAPTLDLGKQHLAWMWKNGLITSMPSLDWVHVDDRARAWGMKVHNAAPGQNISLGMTMPEHRLGSRPLAVSYSEPIPDEKMEGAMKLALKLRGMGIDTPETLATDLAAVGSKAVKHTQALWHALKMVGAKGPSDPDWDSIYAPKQEQAPEPAAAKPQFKTAADVAAYATGQRSKMLEGIQREYGLNENDAQRVMNGLYNEDSDDSQYERAQKILGALNLSHERVLELEKHPEIGENGSIMTPSNRFKASDVAADEDQVTIASTLVNGVRLGAGKIQHTESHVATVASLFRAKEVGMSWSDIARYLDDFTTRNAGSQSDKAFLFKEIADQIKAFAQEYGVQLPAGDLTAKGSYAFKGLTEPAAAPVAGDPELRIREDSPEAAPIHEKINTLVKIGEERHAAMAEGDVKNLTHPQDMLTSEEKGQMHSLQSKLRTKSAEEAKIDVAKKRAAAIEGIPHTTEELFDSTQMLGKVAVPKGATVVRAIDKKGRIADVRVADLKGANPLYQAGPFKSVQPGTFDRKGKFQAMEGEITVAPKTATLGSRPISPEFTEDMQGQARWMDSEAKARGYAGIQDLAEEKPDEMAKLSAQWRTFHPRDEAGMLLQNRSIEAINKALYGPSKSAIPGIFHEPDGWPIRGLAGSRDAIGDALANVRGNARATSTLDNGEEPDPADRGRQRRALVAWATKNDVLLNELPAKLRPEADEENTREHGVFEHEEAGRWLKVTRSFDGSMFGVAPKVVFGGIKLEDGSPAEYLERIQNSNKLFGDDIRLHAVVDDGKTVQIVTSQPDVSGEPASTAQIKEQFEFSGFRKIGRGGFYRKSDNTAVFDAHEANGVLHKGALVIFDAIVTHPTGEMLEYIKDELFRQAVDSSRQPSMQLGARPPQGAASSPEADATAAARAAQPGRSSSMADRRAAAAANAKQVVPLVQKMVEKVKEGTAGLVRAFTELKPVTSYRAAKGDYLGAGSGSDAKGMQMNAYNARMLGASFRKMLPNPLTRQAVSRYNEADGDVAELKMQEALSKKNLAPIYARAANLTPEEKDGAAIAKNLLDEKGAELQKVGLLKELVENYVTHMVDQSSIPQNKKGQTIARIVGDFATSRMKTSFDFAIQRVFKSLFDLEQAGYRTVGTDIADIVAAYCQSADNVIAARTFVRSLTDIMDEDGRPLATVSGSVRRLEPEEGEPNGSMLIKPFTKPLDAKDYLPIDHPALRKYKWLTKDADGNPIFVEGELLIHPSIHEDLSNTLGKSALNKFPMIRAVSDFQHQVKSMMLGWSLFHFVQEGTHALGHGVNPFVLHDIDAMLKDPVMGPKLTKLINRSLLLFNWDARRDMAEGLGGKNGLLSKIPGLGPLNDYLTSFLFEKYIPALKAQMALHALDRNFARPVFQKGLKDGSISEDQVYQKTAEQANDAFGGANTRYRGDNPTTTHVKEMGFIAPDFLESRMRFFKDAFTKYGGEQRRALIILAVAMAVTAKLLERMLTGKNNWKLENTFAVTTENRKYELRSVPGDVLELLESPRWFISGRLSPLISRTALEAITGRDYRGMKRTFGEQLMDLLKEPIPMSVRGGIDKAAKAIDPSLPKSLQGKLTTNTADITGGEQVASAMGARIKRYSDVTQARILGHEWRQKQGLESDDTIYPPSKYVGLKDALEDRNLDRARDEYQLLVKENSGIANAGAIAKGFRESMNRPFSGAAATEKAFVSSLDKTDRATYDRAVASRNRILSQFAKIAGPAKSAAVKPALFEGFPD